MSMEKNEKIIVSARKAWNEISLMFDKEPVIFTNDDEFALFYETLCTELFAEEENS